MAKAKKIRESIILVEKSPGESALRPQVEAEEKYRRKQLRRRIVEAFEQLRSTGNKPTAQAVQGFVFACSNDIQLMREALQSYKNRPDPWANEVWRLLSFTDSQLNAELAQIQEEQRFAIESAKMLIRHRLIDPLVFHVPTTTTGPDYETVGPRQIRDLLLDELGEDSVDFSVQGKFPFDKPGRHEITLDFEMGDPLTITVNLVLDLEQLPKDFREQYETIEAYALTHEQDVIALLKQHMLRTPQYDDDTQLEIARILKAVYALGYWKTAEAQRLLRHWRAGNQALKLARESTRAATAVGVTGFSNQRKLEKEKLEKLQILDLPPLVSHDLLNAQIDINVLQRLFALPEFTHLRGRDIDELSEQDVRSLSPSANWSISDFRAGRVGKERRLRLRPVDTRALAKILLSIAKLQFERLETGTCEADIRFCLSNYSTRMGEYLVQQHGRYDLARDYYMEAISLNIRSAKAGAEVFPAILLFRSFPNDSRVPSIYIKGGQWPSLSFFLHLLDEPRWQSEEVFQTAIRSFLELGARHFQWASRWFEECSQDSQQLLLSPVRSQLELGELADFSDCLRGYCQEFESFQTVLRQMRTSTSLHGIVQTRSQLKVQLEKLGFLLSPTNREIISLLAQAIDSVDGFLRSREYTGQRSNADTAMNLLERVLLYGADNYTALWAEHLGAIAPLWRELVAEEINTITSNIAPVLQISLAEERVSLLDVFHDGEQTRVIFRIENVGSGQADRINIRFHTSDGQCLGGQKHDVLLRANESVEDFITLGPGTDDSVIDLDYVVSYFDLDRQKVEFTSKQPLRASPLVDTPELDILASNNPYKTDHEVEDERMFVGRDQLLEQVSTYAIDQPRGSLLMLHGQRRVGKSSLLSTFAP